MKQLQSRLKVLSPLVLSYLLFVCLFLDLTVSDHQIKEMDNPSKWKLELQGENHSWSKRTQSVISCFPQKTSWWSLWVLGKYSVDSWDKSWTLLHQQFVKRTSWQQSKMAAALLCCFRSVKVAVWMWRRVEPNVGLAGWQRMWTVFIMMAGWTEYEMTDWLTELNWTENVHVGQWQWMRGNEGLKYTGYWWWQETDEYTAAHRKKN